MPHIFNIENSRFKIILCLTLYDVLKSSRNKAILTPKGYVTPNNLSIEDLIQQLDQIGAPYVYIDSYLFYNKFGSLFLRTIILLH